MNDKKKFYELDEVGIVGVQRKYSLASKKYHFKKTGEAILKLKNTSPTKKAKKQMQ